MGDLAALPRAGRQPGVSGHLAPVIKVPVEAFQGENRNKLWTDTLEAQEKLRR